MYVAPLPEERFKVNVGTTEPSSIEDLRRLYPGHGDGRGYLREPPSFHLDASLERVRPVTGEIECVIKRFGGYETIVHKDIARAWAAENRCRYPFSWERDAFFKAHPEIPGQVERILDLGSILDIPRTDIPGHADHHVCVRELGGHRGVRIFTSCDTEESSGIYSFLFIAQP